MKNVYNVTAKEWVAHVRDKNNIAHAFIEKPAMHSKIPNLKGKRVLCIGCGSGEECDYLSKKGAKEIIGIDLSRELIKIAKESYPNLKFEVMDMKKMNFPKNHFDFVYSSLAIHYVEDWESIFKKVYGFLKKKGAFIFSTGHPAMWGCDIIEDKKSKAKLLGYKRTNKPRKVEVFGDCLNARVIKFSWFCGTKTTTYYKPFETIFKDIKKSGFIINDLLEPKPIPVCKKIDKESYDKYSRVPLFVIFELKK